jgi:type II secretory pathway pseudopilin PulG
MRGPWYDENGFALPAVIFLVALLTLLLTTGLSRVQADRQIAEASEATADAFVIAQSGLQNYLGTRSARPPDGDSVRINLVGGYANVVSTLVRNPSDSTEEQLFLVRSTGYVIDLAAGAFIQAKRTVAQFADWQTGSIERGAALTAANGVRVRNGPSPTDRLVSGYDASSGPACPAPGPAIVGMRTTTVNGPSDLRYSGVPDSLVEVGGGTGYAVATDTDIDWAGALAPAFVPDYTTFQNGDMTRPIQRVTGDLTLNGSYQGSGILIVTGNLNLSGSAFSFEGIILVGDAIMFQATSITIQGMVVSGLNMLLGGNPARTELLDENELLQIGYHACFVDQGLAALTGLAPVANAWLDSWATY